jgi:hypothetical protein
MYVCMYIHGIVAGQLSMVEDCALPSATHPALFVDDGARRLLLCSSSTALVEPLLWLHPQSVAVVETLQAAQP